MSKIKTARQVVASRRNLAIARQKRLKHMSPRAKKILRRTALGVGAGAAIAGATYGGYRATHTTLYHSTGHHQARQIVKHQQWKTGKYTQGKVYFHKGKPVQMHGPSSVKIRVSKKKLRHIGRVESTKGNITIRSSDLKGIKVRKHKDMATKKRIRKYHDRYGGAYR